jgi:hypothetical protein
MEYRGQQAGLQLFTDRQRDVCLRDDDPGSLEDVATYVRDYVAADRDRLQQRIEERGGGDDEFVEVLTAKSAGNFMYLTTRLWIAPGVEYAEQSSSSSLHQTGLPECWLSGKSGYSASQSR